MKLKNYFWKWTTTLACISSVRQSSINHHKFQGAFHFHIFFNQLNDLCAKKLTAFYLCLSDMS